MHWHRKINLKLIPPIEIAFRRVAKRTQKKKSHKRKARDLKLMISKNEPIFLSAFFKFNNYCFELKLINSLQP